MTEYIQIITTTEKKADAEKISQILVEKKLAGCVQIIGPITSTFWWEEKIDKAEEWLCLIKTNKNLYNELEQAIRSVHPYKVPEILAISVITGSKDYLSWLESVLKKKD